MYVGGNPVCDDNWNNNSASVICKELGWEGGYATKESHFGPVHTIFSLTNVACDVQDQLLSQCRYAISCPCSYSCSTTSGKTSRPLETAVCRKEREWSAPRSAVVGHRSANPNSISTTVSWPDWCW